MSGGQTTRFEKSHSRHQVSSLRSVIVSGTNKLLFISDVAKDDTSGNALRKRETYVAPEDFCSVALIRLFDDHHRSPTFSLDPADRTNPKGPRTALVHMPEKNLRNTFLGQMMYEADYYLKLYNFGVQVREDGTLEHRSKSLYKDYISTSDVRGQRIKQEFLAGKLSENDLKEPTYNRKWIITDKLELEEQGDTLHFKNIAMGVDTRVMVPDPNSRMGLRDVESADDPDSNLFCERFKLGYSKLAEESPQLGHVRELSKLVSVIEWIEERGWGLNLDAVEKTLKEAIPFKSIDTIRTVEDVQQLEIGDSVLKQLLYGGVDMGKVNTKTQEHSADHAAVVAAGKYTEGTVGAKALAALQDLEKLLEALPEDSPEAIALKNALKAEVAAAIADIAAGKVVSDADVAALGARLGAIAAAAPADLPPDAALLRDKVAGLSSKLQGTPLGAPGGAATAVLLAGLGASAHGVAVASNDIANRNMHSADAKALQGDIKAVLAAHKNLLDPKLAALATPEEINAFIVALEKAKEKHALSADPETMAAVAELEGLIGKIHPDAIAAAAAVAAIAAAGAASNKSRNEKLLVNLDGLTESQYSDDPDDAAKLRAELKALLLNADIASPEGARSAEATDKFLAALAALEAKHYQAPGVGSEELHDVLNEMKALARERANHVANRNPNDFIEKAKTLGDTSVYPTSLNADAKAYQDDLRNTVNMIVSQIAASGKPATGADAATLHALLAGVQNKFRPLPGSVPHAQFAALDAAVSGLLNSPGLFEAPPDVFLAAAKMLADPAQTKVSSAPAKNLQTGISDELLKSHLIGPFAIPPTGENIALLRTHLAAVSGRHAPNKGAEAAQDKEERELKAKLDGLLGMPIFGAVLAPHQFVKRATDIADPAIVSPGNSADAAALQSQIKIILANTPFHGPNGTATPEDIAILRGKLMELSSQYAGKAENDADLRAVKAALDGLTGAPIVTSSGTPHEFIVAAERLGNPAHFDTAGSSQGAALQNDIRSRVATTKAKISPSTDHKTVILLVDGLKGDLRKVLVMHTPAGGIFADAKHRDLHGALRGLLDGSIPDDPLTVGPNAHRLKEELKKLSTVPSHAPADQKALAGDLGKVHDLVPSDRKFLTADESNRILAELKAVQSAHKPKDGEEMSYPKSETMTRLAQVIRELESDISGADAAKAAALIAGLSSVLGATMLLAQSNVPTELDLAKEGLHGEAGDLLFAGQYAKGKFSATYSGKRGGEKSRFGNNPRFLVVPYAGDTKLQAVLTISSKCKGDFSRPFLYAYHAEKFPAYCPWWKKEILLDLPQRVFGRQVRVDFEVKKGTSIVLIPATEKPIDGDFTITIHSYKPVHITPVVWVPKENPKIAIHTVKAAFEGNTVDVLNPAWKDNPQFQVDVTRKGTFYGILRKVENDDTPIRIDHAINDSAHSGSTHLEAGFTMLTTGDRNMYEAVPEIMHRFELPEGRHFIVPSTHSGKTIQFMFEFYGAPGSFTMAKATNPHSGTNIKDMREIKHDPSVVASSVGLNGHVTF